MINSLKDFWIRYCSRVESEMVFIVYFLFTSMCVLPLTFFLMIIDIFKIKYCQSDNSTVVHAMNDAVWIVTANPFLIFFPILSGFFGNR